VRALRRWLGSLVLAAVVTASVADAADFRLLEIGGFRVKWGEPVSGTAAEVSYGFADAPQAFPDAANCGELASISRLAEASGVRPDRLAALSAAAFEMWSEAASVDFRPARAGETPDILIGAQARPQGIAFANVWPDRSRAKSGVAPLVRATICLNPALDWTDDASGPADYDFVTVLAHEIGHTLGLDHPGPIGALMGYSDQGDVDWLMQGDIAGARLIYGVPGLRRR